MRSMNTKRDKPTMISYHQCLKHLKKAFSYKGAVAWNNLPTAIKNSESINIFKAKLKDNK